MYNPENLSRARKENRRLRSWLAGVVIYSVIITALAIICANACGRDYAEEDEEVNLLYQENASLNMRIIELESNLE